MTKSTEMVCPDCETGILAEQVLQRETSFEGKTIKVEMRYRTCSCCGSEVATPEDTRANLQAMLHARELHKTS